MALKEYTMEKVKTVRLLTKEQAKSCHCKPYNTRGALVCPVEDADGNMIISEEVVERNINPEFWWFSSLPKIPHNPKVVDMIGFTE